MRRPTYLPAPTLSGPKEVRIGSARYSVPADAATAAVRGGVYVRESNGRVHLFDTLGEVVIPPELLDDVLRLRFGISASQVTKLATSSQAPTQRVLRPHPSEPRSDLRAARARLRKKAAGA